MVTVTVQNDGPADASNIAATLAYAAAAGGTQTDTSPPSLACNTPAAAAFLSGYGSQQAFIFNCSVLGGNGTVVFTGSATASYVNNPAATVLATALPGPTFQIIVDTTLPTLSFNAASPAANGAGWNRTDVTFTYNTADNLSGVAGSTPNQAVITSEGTNLTTNVTVTDNAGNAAVFTTSPVKIDRTPPTLNFGAANPSPNGAGWNKTDVSYSYTTADALSGVATSAPPSPAIISTEGTGLTTQVTVTDVAGNTATFTTSPAVKIDKTAPTSTFAAPSPGPNGAGWNKTDVSYTYSTADNLSGVANSMPNPAITGGEGRMLTTNVTVTDVAGNSAIFSTPPANIDRTSAAIIIASPANGSTYVLNQQITPDFTCTEAADKDLVPNCLGSPSSTPYIASTVGNNTFTVTATDEAGNSSMASTSYQVNYNFTGFQSPLQAAGTAAAPSHSGGFPLNSMIPVAWRLVDANAVAITDPLALTSIQAFVNPACAGPPDAGSTPIVLFANGMPGDALTIDAAGNYTFNWDTNTVASACYNLVVTLHDGNSYATIARLGCIPPPSNLSAWWPGDGNANDIAGSNAGTLQNGAGFAPGIVGQAFSLDGISQFVDAGNGPALQVSGGDFTVMAWVNFSALSHPPGNNSSGPQGDMSIVDKMSGSGINQDGWRLLKQDDNHFWFCLGGGAANGCISGASTSVVSSTSAVAGTWFHVAAVKTATSISIYVNGQLENTTILGAFTDTNTTDLLIGSYTAQEAILNGLIDEVQLFNGALTATEIQGISAAGSAGECKP